MELKTLKDLACWHTHYEGEYSFEKEHAIKILDLKEEAIKRIKFYLSEAPSLEILKINHERKVRDKIMWKCDVINVNYSIIGAIEELVDFFNITPGDLK